MSKKVYLGRKVKEKHYVIALPQIMESDETVIAVIEGRLTRGTRRRGDPQPPKGLLFITDRRVIFYIKKVFGKYEQLVFPYEQLTSVYNKKGHFGDALEITSMMQSVSIDWIPKGDGQVAADQIKSMMQEAKKQKVVVQAVQVEGGSQQIDIAGQIEKLGKLKNQGLLTEEEFELKKKELLDKL